MPKSRYNRGRIIRSPVPCGPQLAIGSRAAMGEENEIAGKSVSISSDNGVYSIPIGADVREDSILELAGATHTIAPAATINLLVPIAPIVVVPVGVIVVVPIIVVSIVRVARVVVVIAPITIATPIAVTVIIVAAPSPPVSGLKH